MKPHKNKISSQPSFKIRGIFPWILFFFYVLLQSCISPASLQSGRICSSPGEGPTVITGLTYSGLYLERYTLDDNAQVQTKKIPVPTGELKFLLPLSERIEFGIEPGAVQLRAQVAGNQKSAFAASLGFRCVGVGVYHVGFYSGYGAMAQMSIHPDPRRNLGIYGFASGDVKFEISEAFAGGYLSSIKYEDPIAFLNGGLGVEYRLPNAILRLEGMITQPSVPFYIGGTDLEPPFYQASFGFQLPLRSKKPKQVSPDLKH